MSNIRHHPIAPTEVRVLASGDEVDLHVHDDHQLIYASHGVLEVSVAEGTWFTPSTRAVWVPGGTPHIWQVHGSTTVHMVGIPHRYVADTDGTPSLMLVAPLVRELVIACSHTGPAQDAKGQRMLRVLIDQLERAAERATMLPTLHDDRLRRVQKIVEADLSVSPSLPQLARAVAASERTLSRLFQENIGMSFTVWRNQLRLHQASLLLAQGLSVTHVAAACGYSSPSLFISVFKDAFGQTPGSLYRAGSGEERASE